MKEKERVKTNKEDSHCYFFFLCTYIYPLLIRVGFVLLALTHMLLFPCLFNFTAEK